MQNNNSIGKYPAKLYIAYDLPNAPLLVDGVTTYTQLISYIESNALFHRAFGIQNLKTTEDFGAITGKIAGDECDYKESEIYQPENMIEFNYLEVYDKTSLEIMTGRTALSIAGTPLTGLTILLTSGFWAHNIPYRFGQQNANGDVPTIATVIGSVSGPITAYNTIKIGSEWFISFESSVSLAQNITVTYGVTPAVSYQIGSSIIGYDKPSFIAKIVTCPNPLNQVNTLYFTNCVIDGQMTIEFINFAKKGGDFAGAPLKFKQLYGGQSARDIQTI